MRVPDGGGTPTKILDGLVDPAGRLKWMGFIREPVVSPDGNTIAMASDLPDPTSSDVTLKLLNLRNDKITDLGLDQVAAARPPGPGVAARRAAPRLRPRRSRRREGDAADLPLHALDEEDPRR